MYFHDYYWSHKTVKFYGGRDGLIGEPSNFKRLLSFVPSLQDSISSLDL